MAASHRSHETERRSRQQRSKHRQALETGALPAAAQQSCAPVSLRHSTHRMAMTGTEIDATHREEAMDRGLYLGKDDRNRQRPQQEASAEAKGEAVEGPWIEGVKLPQNHACSQSGAAVVCTRPAGSNLMDTSPEEIPSVKGRPKETKTDADGCSCTPPFFRGGHRTWSFLCGLTHQWLFFCPKTL